MKRTSPTRKRSVNRNCADQLSASKLRILITAGPTREYIDPVRFLSNDSSGRMGFALAEEAKTRGHFVTLIHGPVDISAPEGVKLFPVVSADEMFRACRRAWPRHDVLIMAAAVADYRPRMASTIKIKKQKAELTLELEPTVDILETLAAQKRKNQRVIGFALEDRKPRQRARDKLMRKRLDAIVLNPPRSIAARSSRIEILLVQDDKWLTPPYATKSNHAAFILDLLNRLFEGDDLEAEIGPRRANN